MVQINTTDIDLTTQELINFRCKFEVYEQDGNTFLGIIEGTIVSGNSTISAESDVRRTFSLSVIPDYESNTLLGENSLIWIDRKIIFYIGIQDMRTKEYTWYKQGSYINMSTSSQYDATTNTLTLSCSDMWTTLDGTINGYGYGALETDFPAYEEKEISNSTTLTLSTSSGGSTFVITKYNYIRDIVIKILTEFANISSDKLNVSEIGEHFAFEDFNDDWEAYREQSKVQLYDGTYVTTWDALPSDQEFSTGITIATMLTTLRDLYPNYEMFFDEEENFVCQLIPSCYDDDIIFDDIYLQSIYISENTTIDLSTIRNITMVWGEVIDADYYTEDSTLNGACYDINLAGYGTQYYNADRIAVLIKSTNPVNACINVNGLGTMPIYDSATDDFLEQDQLEANTVYVFKIKSRYLNRTMQYIAYLEGHWQAQGMDVLTNGTLSENDYLCSNGTTVKFFSKEYFQDKYNCEYVHFTVADSPFTVQMIGERLGVCSSGEFSNITSSSLAQTRAVYENWKTCRLTDNVTIITKLCPFADVNIKVLYRRSDKMIAEQYIVKSISHDWSTGQTTWNLVKFYPLYNSETNVSKGTWQIANQYTWGYCFNYSWNIMKKIK